MADDMNIVDTPIGDLTNLANAPDDALLVVEYLGKAYNSTLGQLKAALGAITSFKRTSGNGTPGSTDVYTVTFANGGKLEMPIPIAKNGTDAVSPTAEVTETDTGWHIVITDKNGKHPFDISNGKNGKDGVSPTAKVTPTDTGWNVVITDKDGPKSFNITNGKNGKDGTSVTAGVSATDTGWHVVITDKDGEKSFDLLNGLNGKDGVSPDVSVQQVSGGYRITITDKDGAHYFTLKNGESSSADWEQKYPDGAGYVKNRPIFKDVYGVNGKVIEASVNFTTNFASVEGLQEKALAQGGKYIVNWNGRAYLCEGKYDASDGHYIGNLALLGTGALDTGEPFYIMCLHDNVYSIAKDTNTAESISVIVTGEEIVDIKKLPWWGVPEGYPYRETIKTDIIPERIAVPSGAFGKVTSPVTLTIGSQYIVNWGGKEYPCVGKEYVTEEMTSVCVGDVSSLTGGESTGEPFAVVMIPDALAAELGCYARIYKHSGTLATKISVTEIKDVVHPMDKDLLPPDLGGGVTDYNKLENKPVGFDVVEILPETTGEVDPDMGVIPLPNILDIVAGNTYTVNWNGVEYHCKAQAYSPMDGFTAVALGDISGAMGEGESTGEPFVIVFFDADLAGQMGAGANILPLDGSTSATLSITGEVVKKLDMKFLPEGYPYKTVEQVEILPETTGEVDPDIGGFYLPNILDIVVGNAYTVNWNGVEYRCKAQAYSPMDGFTAVALGDVGGAMGGESTGEPFAVSFFDADLAGQIGAGTAIVPLDGSTSATLSIIGKAKVVHKLAEEYLPDGTPYAEPFDEVIFDAWPEGVWTGWTYYVTTPVNPLTPGYVYKVNWNGVIYECVARAITVDGGSVCLLGNGGFGVLGSLDKDYNTNEPFEIVIYNTPMVASDDETLIYGGMSSVDATAATEFSVTGAYKVRQISKHCLPEIKVPLVVTFTKNGDKWDADTLTSVAEAELKKGRLVMARYTEKKNYDRFLNLTKVDDGLLVFSGCFVEDNNVLIKQITWESYNNTTNGKGTLSTYTLTATAE